MRLTYRDSFLKDVDILQRGRLKDALIEGIEDLKEADSIDELLRYYPIKKLRGHDRYYRLRIENYRLGFRLEQDGSLTLLRFLNRDEIYSRFP